MPINLQTLLLSQIKYKQTECLLIYIHKNPHNYVVLHTKKHSCQVLSNFENAIAILMQNKTLQVMKQLILTTKHHTTYLYTHNTSLQQPLFIQHQPKYIYSGSVHKPLYTQHQSIQKPLYTQHQSINLYSYNM